MSRLAGYTDRASIEPGGELGCHVGLLCAEEGSTSEYTAQLVRVIGADEADGSERIEPLDSPVNGSYVARVERTATGSYGTALLTLPEGAPEGLALDVAVMPTRFEGREQGVLGLGEVRDDGLAELSLVIDEERHPALVFVRGGSDPFRLASPERLEIDHWYRLVGGLSAGEAFIAATPIDDAGSELTPVRQALPVGDAGEPELRRPTAYFAARPSADGDGPRHGSAFTGRLQAPAIAAIDATAPTPVGPLPESAEPLAEWDLGRRMSGFSIEDVSGNGNHGELFGLPMRAVTDAEWDGGTTSVHEHPDQYRAIHFFADAIEDAAWPQAFSITVPNDLRSGLYAFVLRSEDDTDTVPFVVSPPAAAPADLLLVLPTATYLAYSNSRWMWERVNYEVQIDRTVDVGREGATLIDHPELGASSYDQYLDGTNITQVSWRRPNLDMRIGQCRGENYPSDLRLIDWLESNGYRYDVCTDGDLDREGSGLLDRYRVAVTGTHPEYASSRAYEALESFVAGGGRLAVLGGDVFTWLVAFSPDRPWIMEVRKPDHRPPGSRGAVEGHLALTGEHGADPDRPRPSERLLGMSSTSMGFDAPRPYERLLASDDADVEFVFAGVDTRVIGDDTVRGGVVFGEWDNTTEVSGFVLDDAPPKVLATSSGHSPTTRWFGAGKRRSHAEMTFFASEGGGAVFSASSMQWCRCLDRADVSAITANVLDRFLDPAPLRSSHPPRS